MASEPTPVGNCPCIVRRIGGRSVVHRRRRSGHRRRAADTHPPRGPGPQHRGSRGAAPPHSNPLRGRPARPCEGPGPGQHPRGRGRGAREAGTWGHCQRGRLAEGAVRDCRGLHQCTEAPAWEGGGGGRAWGRPGCSIQAGGGFGMTPWCDDLVCSWRRLLADRHSLPFPWTLSLHRRWCPSASHHPLPFLFLHALTFPLPFPFPSLGLSLRRPQAAGGGGQDWKLVVH